MHWNSAENRASFAISKGNNVKHAKQVVISRDSEEQDQPKVTSPNAGASIKVRQDLQSNREKGSNEKSRDNLHHEAADLSPRSRVRVVDQADEQPYDKSKEKKAIHSSAERENSQERKSKQ